MPERDRVVAELRRTFKQGLGDLADRLEGTTGAMPGGAGSPGEETESLAPGELPDRAIVFGAETTDRSDRDRVVAAGIDGVRKVAEGREDELTPEEQVGVEAIIVLEGRPPLFIQQGDFLQTPVEWQVLDEHRESIKASIQRVGRVEVSGHPNFQWVGTGFLAGPDAIVTNRHVAREFARQDGDAWTFEPGMSSKLDFNEEHGALEPVEFEITGILGVHEQFDLAVLSVAQTGGAAQSLPDPLAVAAVEPASVLERPVYVVGYPAWDGRRNDPTYMRQIFRDIYDVKRLQPGLITSWVDGSSVFTHDCSTLGGNSGSPVFDLETHEVVGLHFGGRYLVGNNAVPLWQLVNDPLLRAAGINFAAAPVV